MNAERFGTLTSAYGADLRRWPAAERDSALAFMAADKVRAERILFEARQLDAALDASPAPEVSHALRDAILAAAPPPRPERKPLFNLGRWAVAGAALASACVVGVMAGAGAVQSITADAQADALIADVADLPVDEQEILG